MSISQTLDFDEIRADLIKIEAINDEMLAHLKCVSKESTEMYESTNWNLFKDSADALNVLVGAKQKEMSAFEDLATNLRRYIAGMEEMNAQGASYNGE